MNLAEHLRDRRKARQLSQEQTAYRAGISVRTYRSLEGGEALNPYYATLSRIAGVLGVSVAELMGEEELAGKAPARA